MTFISHAQNFEDVILWRALRHIENGFYIDVGAWSPDMDSVTRAFYDRGWRGINIEPNPEFHRELELRRGRDENLRVAVGDREGRLMMNFLSNPGLSTLDKNIAEQHHQAGCSINREQVEVTTLQAIWTQYVPAHQDVHFLKVDVEGFEEAVLRGLDWSIYRPWIVIAEATLPMSQIESYEAWEPILLHAGYQLAYVDGLNRFYVSREHSELGEALKYPPNIFDGFKRAEQEIAEVRAGEALARASDAEARAGDAEARAEATEARIAEAEACAREAEVRAANAEAHAGQLRDHSRHWQQVAGRLELERNSIRRSWSWRVTAPLRFAVGLVVHPGATLRNAANGLIRGGIVTLERPLIFAMGWVLRQRTLRDGIGAWLRRYPHLHQHLVSVATRSQVLRNGGEIPHAVEELGATSACGLTNLPRQARRIYAELLEITETDGRIN